jgi:hypothetical protein
MSISCSIMFVLLFSSCPYVSVHTRYRVALLHSHHAYSIVRALALLHHILIALCHVLQHHARVTVTVLLYLIARHRLIVVIMLLLSFYLCILIRHRHGD